MSSLSIDFSKDYMTSGFPLSFICHFEFELMESSSQHFKVPLAQERVAVKHSSSLQDFRCKNFRFCEGNDVFQRVVQNLCPHEVLKI
jgi:hypothetical protein